VIERRVTGVQSDGRSVRIALDGAAGLEVDLALDARGFPAALGDDHLVLSEIPTDAALMRRGPTMSADRTRAVARPHGWVFVIPLTTHTSYGYVYHARTSSRAEVEADLTSFLQCAGVPVQGVVRALSFPSFVHLRPFDGALLRIGNAAAFMEPLEATAIGVILFELRLLSYWLADGLLGIGPEARWEPGTLAQINQELVDTVRAIALFVSWHYACGSCYDTPFWRHARACYDHARAAPADDARLAAFDTLVNAGALLAPGRKTAAAPPSPQPPGHAFGGFDAASFAQIGRGIGFYGAA
jgi:tryptophan halogenase